MNKSVVIHSLDDLTAYKEKILSNLKRSTNQLQLILNNNDPLDVFKILKFTKCATEPLTSESENLIEVINQSMTYIISIMAVEYLYRVYNNTFIINFGNVSGYDIISEDKSIVCECFAATSYTSNHKLVSDMKRLSESSAAHKYEFFYDKEFTDKRRQHYKEKYPDIEIVKFKELIL
jgi:hypothetical protein